MQRPILALLGTTLVLSACASQPPSTAEQALNRYGAKAQFTTFRPLQPDFKDEPAGEYRLVPGRHYQGRGQMSHYRWERVPLQ